MPATSAQSDPTSTAPAASLTADSIELETLDPRFVPAAALRSEAGQVLWAAGEPSASEVWRFEPGSLEPERLFASPREDSSITSVAANATAVVFVEVSATAFGEGGWRVWLLPAQEVEPVELARGNAKAAGYAPTIAMDDRRVAWAGFDEPRSGAISRISVVSVDDPDDVVTLVEHPVRDGLLWFPELNGDELWYGIIKGDFDATGVGDELHLETLDLANPGAAPVEFAGHDNDFNPAVDDAHVVWKSTEPGDSALNWGTLHVLDRATEARTTIPVPMADRPSLGERFVAFDEITRTRLELFDLRTGTLLDLREPDLPSSVHFGGQSVSGRLFTFFRQDGGDPPTIGWAMLPE